MMCPIVHTARYYYISIVILMFPVLMYINSTHASEPEKENTGWSFYFDNDLFALGERDNDYTGGVALKFSGSGVKSSFLSFDSWLEKADQISGLPLIYEDKKYFTTHSMEMGFTLFTPEDLTISSPIFNQHPYASLFFINNTRMAIVPDEFLTYQSSLTVGFLGLPLGAEVHKSLHKMFGAEKPRGWDNQISAGGEPTFKYSVSRSRNYVYELTNHKRLELKTSAESNIGYSTDIGASISLRWGSIRSPWWSFNPHNAEYISLGSPIVSCEKCDFKESYLWLGMSLKYRLYNALLQGQFRDSEVTFDRDELVPVLAEFWLGYTHEFAQHWQLSAFLRARSQEIDLPALSDPVWGGFIISRIL